MWVWRSGIMGHVRFLWGCGVCLPVGKAGVLVVSLLTSWLACWILVAVVIFLQIWLNVD